MDGMDTYLLLRSNKQSGPYTIQQLVNLGLKPYDLVWIEGKSAAWRYPSEVDGLKSYAPTTEEQPYDRFYKKTEETKPEEKPAERLVSTPVAEKVSAPVAEKKEEIPVLQVENKIPTSKKVFVSMPGNSSPKKPAQVVTATAPVAELKPVVKEKIVEKRAESKPIQITEETNESIVTEKKVVKEEPVLNEKYSESLDDIKKRYTETYLNRKKRSGWTSTHTSIAQVFGGAIFFCMLVVFVYKNFSGEESAQQSRTTVIQPNKKDINTKNQTATNNTPVTPAVNKEPNKPKEKKQEAVKNDVIPQDESLATVPVLAKNEETATNANDYSILVNAPEKKAEEPAEEVKPKVRPVNIHRLVNVRANNYRQMAFGGVKNLELTVNNDSKFALDKVIVELQYLKPSEQPIKTERIVFNSIGAGDSKTLRIPDYLRGVKVAYRVLDIASTQYDRQTAGL